MSEIERAHAARVLPAVWSSAPPIEKARLLARPVVGTTAMTLSVSGVVLAEVGLRIAGQVLVSIGAALALALFAPLLWDLFRNGLPHPEAGDRDDDTPAAVTPGPGRGPLWGSASVDQAALPGVRALPGARALPRGHRAF